MTVKTSFSTIAAALLIVACNSESEQARNARLVFEEAQAAYDSDLADQSLQLLDSLQTTYTTETQWLRKAMKLRPHVMKKAAEQRIAVIDDSIAIMAARLNEVQSHMLKINDSRLVEPFYVDKATYRADFLNGTGIEPRVSDIGQFYIVSSINPGSNHHTGFTAKAGDGTESTAGPVAYDGEMNYRINNSEVVTYSPELSRAVGEMASLHPGAWSITFTGGTPRTVKLTAAQVGGIAHCWEYASVREAGMRLTYDRERQLRIIDIADGQIERMSSSDDE